jgi:hypothetical protein
MAASWSGLKNNTIPRELVLESRGTTTASTPMLTSLRDHPLLRWLCLRGHAVDLTGLETVLPSDNSRITELDIDYGYYYGGIHLTTLDSTHVL